VLVSSAQDFYIIDPRPAQKLDKKLATATMSMTVDPMAEWHQMFNDAWRIERDYFYDPGMHGVDWKAMRTRYGKMIDDAVSRWDVTFVIGELIGELNRRNVRRADRPRTTAAAWVCPAPTTRWRMARSASRASSMAART
jgi:tricorn protease